MEGVRKFHRSDRKATTATTWALRSSSFMFKSWIFLEGLFLLSPNVAFQPSLDVHREDEWISKKRGSHTIIDVFLRELMSIVK